jgi:hypothetical protein
LTYFVGHAKVYGLDNKYQKRWQVTIGADGCFIFDIFLKIGAEVKIGTGDDDKQAFFVEWPTLSSNFENRPLFESSIYSKFSKDVAILPGQWIQQCSDFSETKHAIFKLLLQAPNYGSMIKLDLMIFS